MRNKAIKLYSTSLPFPFFPCSVSVPCSQLLYPLPDEEWGLKLIHNSSSLLILSPYSFPLLHHESSLWATVLQVCSSMGSTGLRSFRINLAHFMSCSSSLKEYAPAPAKGSPLPWEDSSCVVSYTCCREIFAVTPGDLIPLLLLWQKKTSSVCTAVSSFSLSLPMWHFFPFLKIHFSPRCPHCDWGVQLCPVVGCPCHLHPIQIQCCFWVPNIMYFRFFLLAGNSNFYMATDLIQ